MPTTASGSCRRRGEAETATRVRPGGNGRPIIPTALRRELGPEPGRTVVPVGAPALTADRTWAEVADQLGIVVELVR